MRAIIHFSCHCKEGYGGVHCTQRSSSCTSDSCGHGFCVPDNSEHRYTCICDQGWKKSEDSPACIVDVNECESRNPCHTNCTNLPGSFICGPCPLGYEGNGIFCRDINECEVNNGGCNLSPKVQCINTEGSNHCGACPPGWAGDGRSCTPSDENTCASNNLCHPQATCQYISNTAICVCPDHMKGSGFGPSGCVINENNPCKDNPCENDGTCIANGQNYTCRCIDNYLPPTCRVKHPCSNPNICKNGGVCSIKPNTTNDHICTCPEEFVGLGCQRTIDQCGGVIGESTGMIRYPLTGNYHSNRRCAWVFLVMNETRPINLTFSRIDLEASDEDQECTKDYIQIHDGIHRSSPVIGRFCGKHNNRSIVTSSNTAFVLFASNNNTEGSGFEMTWKTVELICGGTLKAESGIIHSPGFPRGSLPSANCKWIIEAPFGKRILFKFFTVNFKNSQNCTDDYLIIFDGIDNVQDSVLEKICTNSLPQPIYSSSHIAIVEFHTNDAYFTVSRFSMHYEIVDQEPNCGGLFTDSRGAFNIVTGLNCEYLIKVPDGLSITITLESLSIPALDFLCEYNSLDIYDGMSQNDPFIGKFCMTSGKRTFKSNNNSILLRTSQRLPLSRTISVTYESGRWFFLTDADISGNL